MDKSIYYRSIPKVDTLLENGTIKALVEEYGREIVMEGIRSECDALRTCIAASEDEAQIERSLGSIPNRVEEYVISLYTPNMKNVINGTGTILHTNLGRAPIARKHAERLSELVCEYANLEYNVAEGKRGERYSHFERLICKITGAEAAMAVNNNAAAVLLVLSSLAKGGEVIVSRGELVEIGGKFRIPDVMEQSGAALVEVGTTNKTHPDDYKRAITEETKALLKVHTSNYKIVGFTETVSVAEMASIAEEYDIPVIEDLGSGVLVDLGKYGIAYEPTVQEALKNGADVVCFSGDKLLGGPQAGIIIGKKKYIDIMKKNPLTRALRIDKFTAAALELCFQEYLSEERAIANIPVLHMITKSLKDIDSQAEALCDALLKEDLPADIEVVDCMSMIGGGSLPMEELKSKAISIIPDNISTARLEARMRRLPVPVIGRVAEDAFLLDLRTMSEEMCALLLDEIVNYEILEKQSLVRE